jgi:hypothetical protein
VLDNVNTDAKMFARKAPKRFLLSFLFGGNGQKLTKRALRVLFFTSFAYDKADQPKGSAYEQQFETGKVKI